MAKGRQAQETAETMRPMPRPNTKRPMPRPTEPITRGTPEQAATAFEYEQKTRKKMMEKIEENMQKFNKARQLKP